MHSVRGQVLWGANNIFQVLCDDGLERQCRLRGKTLDHEGVEQEHNPLICGDIVEVLREEKPSAAQQGQGKGQITRRIPRRNSLQRRNIKRGQPQLLAANVEGVVLLCSWLEPPLRSSFLDRLLIAAQQCNTPIFILVNKVDLIDSAAEWLSLRKFCKYYKNLGFNIRPMSLAWMLDGQGPNSDKSQAEEPYESPSEGQRDSIGAKLGQNFLQRSARRLIAWLLRLNLKAQVKDSVAELQSVLTQQLFVLCGASGVGKSSLCNYFFPDMQQDVREISQKWQRGVHTTTMARILRSNDYHIIDTPGMRNFLPECNLNDINRYYPEFQALAELCPFPSCSHIHEPDCAVEEAAHHGLIWQERYLSYIKLYQDLKDSLASMPEYQTQGKIKAAGEGTWKSKGKGKRGDKSLKGLREIKKNRQKPQWDEEDDF